MPGPAGCFVRTEPPPERADAGRRDDLADDVTVDLAGVRPALDRTECPEPRAAPAVPTRKERPAPSVPFPRPPDRPFADLRAPFAVAAMRIPFLSATTISCGERPAAHPHEPFTGATTASAVFAMAHARSRSVIPRESHTPFRALSMYILYILQIERRSSLQATVVSQIKRRHLNQSGSISLPQQAIMPPNGRSAHMGTAQFAKQVHMTCTITSRSANCLFLAAARRCTGRMYNRTSSPR